jgi:hypothetical protein
MGRHDRKHSKAMRAAVVYAVEEVRLTPNQVVALAAAGELKAAGGRNRLEAFEIADSTIKHYVRPPAGGVELEQLSTGPLPTQRVGYRQGWEEIALTAIAFRLYEEGLGVK